MTLTRKKELTHWGRNPSCRIVRLAPDVPDAPKRIRNWQPPSKLSAVADAFVELLQFLTACAIVALVIWVTMQ